LQTILLDFACTPATCNCSSNPCIDETFDAASTQSNSYWTATSYVPVPSGAWNVYFGNAGFNIANLKTDSGYVRAVRGGL